jgi:hypothetical protein
MLATKSGNFKPVALPEPQTAIARCYSVVDLGTIPNIYNGKIDPKRPTVRKIYITWEFPGLLAKFSDDKGEEPFVVGLEVTASTGDGSNFGKLISAWRNKPLTPAEQQGFDPGQMLGKTALISFIHKRKKSYIGQEIAEVTNENTTLKFNTITQKPKSMECPDMRNPPMNWDWDEVAKIGFEGCKDKFEKLPKWLQRKTADSHEFKQYAGNYKVDPPAGNEEEQPQSNVGVGQSAKKTVQDDW